MAQACDICQQEKPCNQKETLKQHTVGQIPYKKIGVDICDFQGNTYLITVDYYSSFIEGDLITND